ncbi:MAG: flagellar export chaperone FliS [Gemmatimonadales bacterium]
MSYGTNSSRYREMEVLSMSPAQRVVLLYHHLLVNLRQARAHMERGEIEARGNRLLRAEEIVHELAVSLDHEAGGEIAGRLAALYAWLLGEFAAVHLHPDSERLDSAVRVISELHEAWTAVAAQAVEPSATAAG